MHYNLVRVIREELNVPIPPDALRIASIEIEMPDAFEKSLGEYLDYEAAVATKAVENFRKQLGGYEHRHEISTFKDVRKDQNIMRIVFYHNPFPTTTN
jgi:hypothetical protein